MRRWYSMFIIAAIAALFIHTTVPTAEGGEYAGIDGESILRLHGGFAFPTGDFGDAFDTGFGLGVNVAHGVSRSVLLSGGVAYHHFDGDGIGADSRIIPITFNAECVLPSSGKVHPWFGGGVGFYNIEVELHNLFFPDESFSETNFGLNLGAGIGARTNSDNVWGVGFRFHHVFEGDVIDDTEFMTLQGAYGFFL